MIRLTEPTVHVLTAEDIERRENRDRGLVTTIFAPVLTEQEAIESRASFEQFGEQFDMTFIKNHPHAKVFSVSGKRQR